MIRISAGSAACLGLTSIHMDAYPTTAYFLSGNKCLMNCSFCPRSRGEKGAVNRLGRVTWPAYPWKEVAEYLPRAETRGFKRICLQSVRHPDGIKALLELIDRFKKLSSLPLSLSAWIRDEKEAIDLAASGVDRISISLDVVNPAAHHRLKGGSLRERLDLLLSCAASLPGAMSTHIICGLGESEEEVLSVIDSLLKARVAVGLFAFIPLKGTALENATPPPVAAYRRIQAGHFLLKSGAVPFKAFKFENGRLVSYGIASDQLTGLLSAGTAFRTSGCPDCNRPFYNERPGGIIYNYHRELSGPEKEAAFKTLVDSLRT